MAGPRSGGLMNIDKYSSGYIAHNELNVMKNGNCIGIYSYIF
jgi:hypothetical protein